MLHSVKNEFHVRGKRISLLCVLCNTDVLYRTHEILLTSTCMKAARRGIGYLLQRFRLGKLLPHFSLLGRSTSCENIGRYHRSQLYTAWRFVTFRRACSYNLLGVANSPTPLPILLPDEYCRHSTPNPRIF